MKSSALDSSSRLSTYNNLTHPDTSVLQINPTSLPFSSFFALSASSSQQVLTVNSTADTVNPNDGVITLREAIDLANKTPGSAVINFNLAKGAQTITLTGGQLNIQDILIINGTSNLTIDGNGRSRNFEVNSNVSTTLSKLSLVNGSAVVGGAISNAGTVNLVDVTLSRNTALMGGGLANVGSAYVTNTTIDNNRAINGGGINNIGYLNISNSTFSSNSASIDGGGCIAIGVRSKFKVAPSRSTWLTATITKLATEAAFATIRER